MRLWVNDWVADLKILLLMFQIIDFYTTREWVERRTSSSPPKWRCPSAMQRGNCCWKLGGSWKIYVPQSLTKFLFGLNRNALQDRLESDRCVICPITRHLCEVCFGGRREFRSRPDADFSTQEHSTGKSLLMYVLKLTATNSKSMICSSTLCVLLIPAH